MRRHQAMLDTALQTAAPVPSPLSLPDSPPVPTIRARQLQDVSLQAIQPHFWELVDDSILPVTLSSKVEEGFIEVVYKIPIGGNDGEKEDG